MANDDKFTATTTWQAIEANGAEIQNGTFTIFNRENNRIEFKRTDTQPTQSEDGSTFMKTKQDSIKISLSGDERFFCKSGAGSSEIGIVKA